MSESFSRSSRQLSPPTTRPFLNLLNPMGRHYEGYSRAESLLEEDETQEDVEESRMHSRSGPSKRRVSFGGSEMAVLRPNVHDDTSEDDEVPPSFMIEATSPAQRRHPTSPRTSKVPPPPILPTTNLPFSIPPRPSDLDPDPPEEPSPVTTAPVKPMQGLDAYERALWNWVNVYNLDDYLQEVYAYYVGKGIYCIALSRGLNLLTVGFVISFSTFLLRCIDYSRIRQEGTTRLSEVVVDRCVSKFSGFTLLFFICFGVFYLWQLVSFVLSIRALVDMQQFYTHLLGVPEADISTISWPEIVRRIGAIREANPATALSSARNPDHMSTAKLDAHDIANRIMRQENYLIALFNKDLLDLRLPLPSYLSRFQRSAGEGMTVTRAIEWNLRLCLMRYLFDARGQVRKAFLKEKNRATLIEGLRRRFIFVGIMNALFAPFIVIYILMYSFFRYFEEYHKNPSSIGSRRYTFFAEWKFREFNELPHLFHRRLDSSYPTATMYINQFPKEKVALVMRFVAFVAGSFAGVLILASVVDPDLFLHFEITPHRTVLFYITVFGSILAVARGMIPESHTVIDPEFLIREIIHHTHYMPNEWKGQLHSQMVHQEFGKLFDMRISIFFQELLSVVLTPFVLWYSLPKCSPGIIDFFREFTVHVDGLGYVCSFAVFDFKRHGNVNFGAPTQQTDERLLSKEGKMEKSFLNFKAAHPDWNPTDPSGSLYLSRLADFHNNMGALNSYNPPYLPPSHQQQARGRFGAPEGRDNRPLSQASRAQAYERAFQKSAAISSRKRGQQPQLGSASHAEEPVPSASTTARMIPSIDRAPDGGVGSELGDSYIDGTESTESARPHLSAVDQEEAEELANGGVLGLLAQIYDQRRL